MHHPCMHHPCMHHPPIKLDQSTESFAQTRSIRSRVVINCCTSSVTQRSVAYQRYSLRHTPAMKRSSCLSCIATHRRGRPRPFYCQRASERLLLPAVLHVHDILRALPPVRSQIGRRRCGELRTSVATAVRCRACATGFETAPHKASQTDWY